MSDFCITELNKCVIFKHFSVTDILSISWDTAPLWMAWVRAQHIGWWPGASKTISWTSTRFEWSFLFYILCKQIEKYRILEVGQVNIFGYVDSCMSLLMTGQHWFRQWLGAIRCQDIIRTSGDQDQQQWLSVFLYFPPCVVSNHCLNQCWHPIN